MIEITLTKKQADFLTSDSFACLFAAGIGGGKSFVGAHWAKEQVLASPKANGFIGANTYNQLRNATLATFFKVLDEHNYRWSYNQQRNIITVNGTKIYAYSLDNYNNIRGIEAGWAWLDETRDTEKEAFDVVLGRLRDVRSQKIKIRLTSSPCGYNWLYDYFAGPGKRDGYEMVQGSSMDNPFLPVEYINSLKNAYDSRMYEQEVLGQFIASGVGRIYYAFERAKNVAEFDRHQYIPMTLGMDFNVSPFTATICQIVNHTIYVLDEVWINNSNTKEVSEHINNKYPGNWTVVPDSTGKALKTSASGATDHAILRAHGFTVPHVANPFRMDRYNEVNAMLEQARIIIHPRCKNLIKDLEQVTFKEGTNLPETKDQTLTHISDALGYLVHWAFPLVKISTGVSVVDR